MEVLGESHPVLSQVYVSYGNLLTKRGKSDEARTAFERALKVEQAAFGSSSRRAQVLREKVASIGK